MYIVKTSLKLFFISDYKTSWYTHMGLILELGSEGNFTPFA